MLVASLLLCAQPVSGDIAANSESAAPRNDVVVTVGAPATIYLSPFSEVAK